MKKHDPFAPVYEDVFILAINKAPGIAVLPDRYDPGITHLKEVLEAAYGEIYIVHRIDADTSGILLVARDRDTHRMLNLQFQAREIGKSYLALLEGIPAMEEFVIDMPITQAGSGKMRVATRGKEAETRVKVLEQFRQYALAEVETSGGRTHQIRVHLQHAGHPIICDPLYGARTELDIRDIKGKKTSLKKDAEPRPLLQRTALHASGIRFLHPSGKSMTLSADLPKDMQAVLKQLRKWQS